ncbi:hypothetical protein MROS_2674 [Melioribacter roseus P3M-2]|uniref:DUF354 domain-containing protein n=1 Tax=Melioribacter roseus (strain DSM 23840 / JCM 17771 / VKM B-2668 / P3M-2) TaxID=1191523 RepID=I6ZV77_MELRP|nr:DUF354 domain-containing protein [Melioribacter roseus]AFN75904.1 hypothetical protein MROS_2674 [Melioribacter roseus P3M-2]
MKILVKLNHPAHYHLYKNLIKKLRESDDEVIVVIRNKDILKDLLDEEHENYLSLIQAKARKEGNIISIIKANVFEIILQDYKLFKIVKNEKPDVMVGTDTAIAHVGRIFKIPTYIFNEDDYIVNRLFCIFTYPFARHIVSPKVCDVGKYKHKKIEYDGYQKLAYLHPSVFKPNIEIAKKYLNSLSKYYLIRLVSFSAGHDIEKKHSGLSKSLIIKLINTLSESGNVYITSERKLIPEFEKYRLKINPKDIHHVMAFADLFISDSQSMTLEAAMLGVPSIRFNSFVGKISVLNEIEERYGLSIGLNNEYPDRLLFAVNELLKNPNLKNEYKTRRDKMLSEKINLTDFMYKLLKNESIL